MASIKLIFHFSKANTKLLPPLLPQVTVEQRSRVMNVTQEVRTGVLFMVDLAGSERAAITQVRYISYIELDPMTWPSLCPKSNLTFAVMTTQGFSLIIHIVIILNSKTLSVTMETCICFQVLSDIHSPLCAGFVNTG